MRKVTETGREVTFNAMSQSDVMTPVTMYRITMFSLGIVWKIILHQSSSRVYYVKLYIFNVL